MLTVPEIDWVVNQLETWTPGGIRQQTPTALSSWQGYSATKTEPCECDSICGSKQ